MKHNKNVLSVYNGSIYENESTIIEELAFVLDKDCGLVKWGENDRLKKYYIETINKFKSIPGLEYFADNYVYLSFDKYSTILTQEEICTFGNYIIGCSVNGEKILSMLNMSESEMKNSIRELKELGF